MLALLLTYPAINPDLVHLGPFRVRWYALAYIAGLIAGWALVRHVVSDDGYWRGAPRPDAASIDDLLVYCTLGVVVGGRLGQVLLWTPGYFLAHPLEIFMVWRGGMAFHGGMIGVHDRHDAVRLAGEDPVADRSRPRLPRRAHRLVAGPDLQFRQRRAVGASDRRSMGDGVSKFRRPAAPSEPALRGVIGGRA